MDFLETQLQFRNSDLEKIYTSDQVNLYKNFYSEITPSILSHIFSTLHCAFNDLFGFMNRKKDHYNAHQSKQLISIIEFYENLQGKLQGTTSDFILNEYYTETINTCKGFLEGSGGSQIPNNFKIKLIDEEPIFKINSTIDLKVQNQTITSISKKKIGHGSYADVFCFTDPNFGIKVVQKKAKKNLDTKEITRLKIEFNYLNSLESPFIVKAYTYNEIDNSYTMEFIDETLDSYIRKNNTKITLYDRRNLIVQLLKAFKYIHSKELLHRDISYTNILVKTYDDSSQIIKVADLGLVKEKNSNLTGDNSLVKGSLNDYSDLERVGYKNYKMVHETFVLTKIVYFILTGRKNFDKESTSYLKGFLDKGLSPNKEHRFKSVEDLENYLKKSVYNYLN